MQTEGLRVRFQDPICWLQIDRPEANNAINDSLIEACQQALVECEQRSTVVIVEGLPHVFCTGAELRRVGRSEPSGRADGWGPDALYDVWSKLVTGSFVSIAHVRGKVTAGGVGFVAACDVVVADDTAEFALSELLFGLLPACVLPFLARRIGPQKANYMTLMTKAITAAKACEWGLVDAHAAESAPLVRQHLSRLQNLSKSAVARHKRYVAALPTDLLGAKQPAVAMNREVFQDPENIARVTRFVESGRLPWE